MADDARDELQAHLEMQVEQLEAMGRSHEEAVREARLRFGNPDVVLEAIEADRQSRATTTLDEVRRSLRMLRRQPAFLAATVVPLALAMTLAIVTFGVVDAVLLRPLPYANADRIVRMGERLALEEEATWSNRMVDAQTIEAWERTTQTMARLASYHRVFRTLDVDGNRKRIQAATVTEGFFEVLQLPPSAGRYFQPGDVVSADDRPVVVLAYAFWQGPLGGDPAIVGRTIVLDDTPTLVVGIAPPEFRFPDRSTPLWTLARPDDPASTGPLNAIGTLRAEATIESAAAEATAVAQRESSLSHATDEDAEQPVHIGVVTLADDYARPVRRGLLMFAGAALAVLIAATFHVGHLFVVYAQRRRREFAVRAALGAAPWRLTVMAVTAVGGVTITAGGFAALIAATVHAVMPALLPVDFPRLDEIAFTTRSVAVIVGTMAMTTLIGASILTYHLRRQTLSGAATALGSGGARTSAPVRSWSARSLLVAEVAFSAALLIVAGLLARNFLHLATTDTGYAPEGALTAQVSFPPQMAQVERRQIVARLLESLSRQPDVTAAGATSALPLEEVKVVFVFDAESNADASSGERLRGDFAVVSPGYLEALGARIVEGRDFTWDDTESTSPVAIVNRAFMRQHFPDHEAIGFAIPGSSHERLYTIVGVIDDIRLDGPTVATRPAFYAPMTQRSQATFFHRVNLVVRTTDDPLALAGTLREVVRATDARLAMADVTTLATQLAAATARPRLYATMLVTCATVALGIVVIGLFASLAYAAARRRRELAIRMAVGARRTSVAVLLARESLWIVGAGLIIGVGAGLTAGRALGSLLHDVVPSDPLVVVTTVTALGIAAAAAGAAPIASALKTDLSLELRNE